MMSLNRRRGIGNPGRIALLLLLAVGPVRAAEPQTGPSLRERAFAYLWNEQADRAVGCFRRHLQDRPDGEDRQARKGLALALSWSGRQGQAVDLYRRLLAEDPADTDARLGLGRSLIWKNSLRPGWGQLRQAERTGTPATVREVSGFALTVLDEYTTGTQVGWQASWDSDDLDIQRGTVLAAFGVGRDILLQTGPRVSGYRQPGLPDITALRWQLALQAPLRRNLSFNGQGWLEQYRSGSPLPGRTGKLDWTRPGGDAWVTWLPAARWRIDAGASSLPVETYTAMDRHLGFQQANLSCDWRLMRRVTLSAAGRYADYSDGNRRRQGSARLGWRHEGDIHLWAAVSFTYLDFTDPYPGGYWAPDWVRNGSLEAAARWRSGRWGLKIGGSLGLEKETTAEGITVGGGSARLSWRLAPDWLVAVDGGHSRSSLSTASGYHRTFGGVSVRGFF